MVIPRHVGELVKWPGLKVFGTHGWVGVDLFFVLSGFLIGSQLLQAAARDGRVDFKRFYAKRSFRILPAYLVVLLLYFAWPAFREKLALEPAWRFLLFVMNIGPKADAFSHAWSLCVEEHFYLFFPLLLALYLRFPRRLRPVWIFSAIIVGGVALRYALQVNGVDYWTGIYRPTYTHLDGLTVGVGLALLRESKSPLWPRLLARPWLLVAVGVALIAAGMAVFPGKTVIGNPIFAFPLVAFGFGALVAAALAPGFWLAERRIPGAALIAAAAYTLYLTHKQMIHLALTLMDAPYESPVITFFLAVALMAAASAVLYFAVERPFLRLRDRLLHQPPVSATLIASTAGAPAVLPGPAP